MVLLWLTGDKDPGPLASSSVGRSGHSAPPSRSTAGPTLMTTLPLCWTRRRMLGKLRPSQEVEALLIGFLKLRQNTEGEGHDDNNNDNDFEDPSKLK